MLLHRAYFALALFLLYGSCHGRPTTEIQISTDEQEIDSEIDDSEEDDLEFYTPKELKAIETTQTSISLEWVLDADPIDLDISYRIHYKHSFPDVKTISQSDPAYILQVNFFRDYQTLHTAYKDKALYVLK